MISRGKKVLAAAEAAELIFDRDTLAVGGFVGMAVPEALLLALAERFERTGVPRDLTLVFAAGQGDGEGRGLNHLAREGLLRRAIGSHWGLVPALGALALGAHIEAYCLPLGVMSHLYRETAAGRPGVITRVGLGTFVDPALDGGRLNPVSKDEVVRSIELEGEDLLFYPSRPLDVAFLRGTTSDLVGNVSMEREAAPLDSLSIAQAAKSSGGVVIVQVERMIDRHVLPPRDICIPGIFIDAVVVAPDEATHMQTFAERYNPAYVGERSAETKAPAPPPPQLDVRRVIARRAAKLLNPGSVVNIGIGVPEGIVGVAAEEGILEEVKLTVEAGPIGGVPAGGLSFGAAAYPEAIVDMPYQFDFYDAGLDQAFLGMAQVDRHGNVNVSRFGGRLAGAGGFIDISQSARSEAFTGTFTAGAEIAVVDGSLCIRRDGAVAKFVDEVEHVTFSGARARASGQSVLYLTERCVLRLGAAGLELTEIAPGLDLERDVLAKMGFRPEIAPDLREMDAAIFCRAALSTAQRCPLSLEARVEYRADDDLVLLTLGGLAIEGPSEAEAAVASLDQRRLEIDGAGDVIVDCGGFEPGHTGGRYFLQLLHQRDRSGTWAWYCPEALVRRRLHGTYAGDDSAPRIHPSYRRAVAALRGVPDRTAVGAWPPLA